MGIWPVAGAPASASHSHGALLDNAMPVPYPLPPRVKPSPDEPRMTASMTKPSHVLDRLLVLEMVRVTEAAAVAASRLVGRGDERAADHAAVEAMRNALNELDLDGTIVIGEGERDEAPMLYIGERVGARRD